MAASTAPMMVDGQFCAPRRTVFMLTKSRTPKGCEFEVTRSVDGTAAMQVETAHIGYRNLRSLRFLDAASRRPLITVDEFRMGKLPRWEAFKGDGTGTSVNDRLFVAVDKTSLFQTGLTVVHVFLHGDSSGGRAPDFIVHGNYQVGVHGNYQVGAMTVSRVAGDGDGHGHDKDIAKIDRKNTPAVGHSPAGENVFAVWIKPDVDQVLVLALTVVLDQMRDGRYCACSCKHTCGYNRIRRH